MTHRDGLIDRVVTAVRPEVGSADAGRDELGDRVGGLLDGRLVTLVDADLAGGMHDRGEHQMRIRSFG
ncbi:hypothetical protein [Curtobacterium sp. MCBD17_032]|uniref:hypothetical protein n=1 Tax=Curtobacterium sp. MCBD17_032 TaxID=2175659 RepID=UPI0021AD2503|nr:hypothetical protein [Curtobacterium sp. MCBD17_032]